MSPRLYVIVPPQVSQAFYSMIVAVCSSAMGIAIGSGASATVAGSDPSRRGLTYRPGRRLPEVDGRLSWGCGHVICGAPRGDSAARGVDRESSFTKRGAGPPLGMALLGDADGPEILGPGVPCSNAHLKLGSIPQSRCCLPCLCSSQTGGRELKQSVMQKPWPTGAIRKALRMCTRRAAPPPPTGEVEHNRPGWDP